MSLTRKKERTRRRSDRAALLAHSRLLAPKWFDVGEITRNRLDRLGIAPVSEKGGIVERGKRMQNAHQPAKGGRDVIALHTLHVEVTAREAQANSGRRPSARQQKRLVLTAHKRSIAQSNTTLACPLGLTFSLFSFFFLIYFSFVSVSSPSPCFQVAYVTFLPVCYLLSPFAATTFPNSTNSTSPAATTPCPIILIFPASLSAFVLALQFACDFASIQCCLFHIVTLFFLSYLLSCLPGTSPAIANPFSPASSDHFLFTLTFLAFPVASHVFHPPCRCLNTTPPFLPFR